MLISLALSFARQGNGQRATSWVTVARTLAPPLITSLTCAFFYTLLLETVILLYQLGHDVWPRLKSLMKLCLKNTRVYSCLRPRVYTYVAFVKVLRGKSRDAQVFLTRAMHFAELYSLELDVLRIKKCKRKWFEGKKSKNLLNKLLSSRKIHTLLEDEIEDAPEGDEENSVFCMHIIEQTPIQKTTSTSSAISLSRKIKTNSEEFSDIQESTPICTSQMGTINEAEEPGSGFLETDSSVSLIISDSEWLRRHAHLKLSEMIKQLFLFFSQAYLLFSKLSE